MEGPDRAACSWRPCPAAASPLPPGAPPPQGQRHRPWARHSPSCFSRTNPLGGRPARSHRCSRCRPGGGAGSQLKVLKSGHFGLSPCFPPRPLPRQLSGASPPVTLPRRHIHLLRKQWLIPSLLCSRAVQPGAPHCTLHRAFPFTIPLVRQQRALQSRGPGEVHFQE